MTSAGMCWIMKSQVICGECPQIVGRNPNCGLRQLGREVAIGHGVIEREPIPANKPVVAQVNEAFGAAAENPLIQDVANLRPHRPGFRLAS